MLPRSLRPLLVALLLSPAIALAADPPADLPDSQEGMVEAVESAEVLVVKLADRDARVKVRVLGIDCTSRSASKASALAEDATVVLHSDKSFLPILQDNHGRYVAYVELPGERDLGLELVKDGGCTAHQWKMPHPRKTEYARVSPR